MVEWNRVRLTTWVKILAAGVLVLLVSGCGFFGDLVPEKSYAVPGDVPARYQHLLVIPGWVPEGWKLYRVAIYDDNFISPSSILEYGPAGSQRPMLTIHTTESHASLPPSVTKREEWQLANGERVPAAWVGETVSIVWERSTLSHLVEAEIGPDLPKETVNRIMESMGQ